MPINYGIYFQVQCGGLCRLHSLNGYFGKEKISIAEFNKLQKDYDDEYKKKFNFESTCKNFDIVASDQKNIVNYILKKNGVYTRYYAINQLYKKPIDTYIQEIIQGDFFFVYNESHIWGCRSKNGKWFKVDSISGVFPYNINNLSNEKNIGFIIPVNIKKEFYVNLKSIKKTLELFSKEMFAKDKRELFSKEKLLPELFSKEILSLYLIQKHKEKKILGDIEIPLSICMDIFETNLIKKSKSEFNPIKIQVEKYNEFLSKFTDGNYTNIKLILEYLPNILSELISINIL